MRVNEYMSRPVTANTEDSYIQACVLMQQHAVDESYEESVHAMLDQLCVSYLIPKKRDRVERGLRRARA